MEVDEAAVIHVAGLQTEPVTVTTRATDYPYAESIEWLVPSLQAGLDITYWHEGEEATTKRVAQLKLKDDKTAYTFHYKDGSGNQTNNPAKWYGNGFHRFQGFRVSDKLSGESLPANLTKDQSDDSQTEGHIGNYTLLSRYLCMPPNCRIAATVEQIRLPFQHRLARVLAYVLIDPEMGEGVKLKGYTLNDGKLTDPSNTSFWFTNVKVLEKVETTTTSGITTYKPKWTAEPVRKVIPHFDGELGSESHQGVEGRPDRFYVYMHKKSGKRIYPSESAWQTIHDGYPQTEAGIATYSYKRIDYGKVPCFDLIVQPTYSSVVNVMYDESAAADPGKNSIRFELELSNDLRYEKYFEFDLDANQQTVVYLLISREKVDYDNSGSELWIESEFSDGYYGVNNKEEHSLSMAGSSWQRAYRIGTDGPSNVTDGSNYNEDSDTDHITGEDGQYLTKETWLKALKTATKDGTHHGDYFILTDDLTIGESDLPADFVFTGHLDGCGHIITLPESRTYLFSGLNGIYEGTAGTANLHTENGKLVPVEGYRAEVMNLTIVGGTLFKSDAKLSGADWANQSAGYTVTGSVVNCSDTSGPVSNDVGLPDYQ